MLPENLVYYLTLSAMSLNSGGQRNPLVYLDIAIDGEQGGFFKIYYFK